MGEPSLFRRVVDETGSMITPTSAAAKKCSIIFPIPSPPMASTQITGLAVDLYAEDATVNRVSLMLGNFMIYERKTLLKNQSFTQEIAQGNQSMPTSYVQGMALCLDVDFDNLEGKLGVQSVAVKVAVAAVGEAKASNI